MGGFLSSIFTGHAPGIDNGEKNAGQVGGFSTATGIGDTQHASNFLNDIISGNPAAISRLLAPQIDQMAKQANQKIQTEGEFANRSGGVNAANQNTIDTTRGNVDNAIAGLTGNAVGQLGQMGQNLLHTGLTADQLQAQLAQQQLENQQQSLLGGIITKGTQGFLGQVPGLGEIF